MPGRTFRPSYGSDQIFLLSPSSREWLPADLDPTPILTRYGGVTRGAVPSDPRMRVAVLFSCNRGLAAAASLRRSSFVKREAQGE